MIKIRPARVEDADTLCAAEREIALIPGRFHSAPDELDEAAFRDKIETLGPLKSYIVAVVDDRIVGHAFLDPVPLRSRSHVCTLQIGVYPGQERRGIGAAMLDHMIGWARSREDIRKIELHVMAGNAPAIRLYETRGFEVEGVLEHRVRMPGGDYVDVLSMALFTVEQK